MTLHVSEIIKTLKEDWTDQEAMDTKIRLNPFLLNLNWDFRMLLSNIVLIFTFLDTLCKVSISVTICVYHSQIIFLINKIIRWNVIYHFDPIKDYIIWTLKNILFTISVTNIGVQV